MYSIKNAERANQGKAKLDEIGIRVLDDRTLQVTLEHPTPYFLELTAFYPFYPVNKKLATSNPKWAEDVKTHVGNGPFKFKTWEHESRISLVKNDYYWDRSNVKLDGLDFSVIPDNGEELYLYDVGELDWAGAPLGSIPEGAIPYFEYRNT